jgi:hypothetical protein
MLFKNDVRFELSKAEIDQFIEEFELKKFPVRFKYVPELFTDSKDNEKPDRPRSIMLPWLETVNEGTGINAYRYAENVNPGGINQPPVYYPHREMVNEVLVVGRHEIEKIWFLLKYSKHVKGSKNAAQSLNTYLVVEDKRAEAKIKIDAEKEIINLKSLLYDESKLKDDEVKDLAKALYMDGSDELSREEIVEAIISAVNVAQNKSEYCKNIRMLLSNDTVRAGDNVLIQDSVDYDVVMFVRGKGVFFKDAKGQPDELICRVKSGVDWKIGFSDYLAKNVKAKELIMREVEAKKKAATQSE